MRQLLMLVVLGVPLSTVAGDDRVTVKLAQHGEQVVHVLTVEEVVEGDLPMVRVRGTKVRMRDGAVVDTVRMLPEDRDIVLELLADESMIFRVYYGKDDVGIYNYRVVPRDRRPKNRGTWLQALPLDRDASFQELTRDTREDADISNLLDLDLEQVEQAARREKLMNEMIEDAITRERTTLREGEIFLMATRRL